MQKVVRLALCEYAYIGDYTPAQRQLIPAAPNVNRADSPTPARDYAEDKSRAFKKEKKKKASMFSDFDVIKESCGRCGSGAPMQILWDEFERRDYSVVSPKFRPREILEEYETLLAPFLVTLKYMSSLIGTTLPNCVS